MGTSWGNKDLEWGAEESEEITNQPPVTGKSGDQARPAAGVGWGGVGVGMLKREAAQVAGFWLAKNHSRTAATPK